MTKFDLINDIYDKLGDHYHFNCDKVVVVSLIAKYKDYGTIYETHHKVAKGIVPAHEALSYLSGLDAVPIVNYMY